MKPDVKKIIADIKATKGNRKFCNGLAGTLQDDNYASSICKYVKTVTPERIDLLIEYAEKLEAEVTDMAVQLANAESKCRELAAENAGLKAGILQASEDMEAHHDDYALFSYDADGEQMDALLRLCDAQDSIASLEDVKTPATDAFLAEVRAQGVEMFEQWCRGERDFTLIDEDVADAAAYEECVKRAEYFAAQLRKGGNQ